MTLSQNGREGCRKTGHLIKLRSLTCKEKAALFLSAERLNINNNTTVINERTTLFIYSTSPNRINQGRLNACLQDCECITVLNACKIVNGNRRILCLSSFEYDPCGLADVRTSPRQPIENNPYCQLFLFPIAHIRTERNTVEQLIFYRTIRIVLLLRYNCLFKIYCVPYNNYETYYFTYSTFNSIAKLKTANLVCSLVLSFQ